LLLFRGYFGERVLFNLPLIFLHGFISPQRLNFSNALTYYGGVAVGEGSIQGVDHGFVG
jgi:hypothetical protein